jgi:hypothetical protein
MPEVADPEFLRPWFGQTRPALRHGNKMQGAPRVSAPRLFFAGLSVSSAVSPYTCIYSSMLVGILNIHIMQEQTH